MQILSTSGWDDYELIDSGKGCRLERFGKYILSRPDPQIIWNKKCSEQEWNKTDAIFERTSEDKGRWIKKNPIIPEKWVMDYKDLKFWIKLTPFKHTGVFPEQCLQWDFIQEQLKKHSSNEAGSSQSLASNSKIPNVLNLFAYTGIASLAAASAGAKVTHVDASKPAIAWARENQKISHLTDRPIRWILDDCLKFIQREGKRGVKYDGIIMDPPAFGHGPDGSMWKFNSDFPKLLELCKQVLSAKPIFVIVNAYAISSSSIMLENILEDYFGELNGTIKTGELALEEKQNKRLLSTGIFARWISK